MFFPLLWIHLPHQPTHPQLTLGWGFWAHGPGRLWDTAALMDTAPAALMDTAPVSGPPCWDFALGKARDEGPQLPAVISCLLPKAFKKQLPEIQWAQGIE